MHWLCFCDIPKQGLSAFDMRPNPFSLKQPQITILSYENLLYRLYLFTFSFVM